MIDQNKKILRLIVGFIPIVIVVWLITGSTVQAQDNDALPTVFFTRLTTADGLPNNTVWAIHEDAQGFIWFGTGDGLVRYDGYRFVTYKHEQGNPASISNNHIRDLFLDADDVMWVGSANGGVSRFDASSETFTNFRRNPNDDNSLAFNIIYAVAQDRNGRFYFGGPPETGLNVYDPEMETFTRYRSNEDFAGNAIQQMVTDQQGNIWVATNSAVSRFENDEFIHYPIPTEEQATYALLRDENGRLWIGGNAGLFAYDSAADQLVAVPDSPTRITALLQDRHGMIWVGTRNGLFLFDAAQDSWQLFAQHDPLFANSLSRDNVLALHEDSAGNIWIGTEGGGINMLDPGQLQFANYRHQATNNNSLSAGTVSALSGDGDRLWVGAESVLNLWENGRFQQYPLPERAGIISALQASQQGGVWVGTQNSQLFYFDPSLEEFDPYPLDISEPSLGGGTRLVHITDVVEENNGTVWAIAYRDGLHRIDTNTGQSTVFRAERPTGGPPQFSLDPSSIGHFLLSTLALRDDGKIWLGYSSPGISLLDPQTNQFTHYPLQQPIGPAESLLPATDGGVWVATRFGLAKFDPTTETAVLYTEADGLPTNYAVGILPDNEDNLWVSTINGLARFDPATETFDRFDQSDGLMEVDFTPRTAWADENGRFYFGTVAGFTTFDPQEVRSSSFQPPVRFTKLRLFNEPVAIEGDGLLAQAIEQTERLTLNYDDDIISLEFAALSFAASNENQYRYKLEGLEENWNEVESDRRFATYTDLSAGTYLLRVQGSNKDGVWSNEEATLEIVVLPPWWETIWFRSLAALAVIGAIAGAFRWRVQSIRQRNQELEAEVARQTAVVREAESQKQRLAVLEERQRIGRELHDDLGQVLGFVNVQSQAALAQMTQDDTIQLQATLKQLAKVAQESHADVRQYILGIRKGEPAQLPDAFIPTLKNYLQDLATLYDLHTRLSLPPDWDELAETADEMFSQQVATQLLRIIQESLTNVRKHAGVNKANLLFTDHDDTVQVIISDEGKGFDPLLAYAESADSHFGLTIMQERAEKGGGTFRLRAQPGGGTEIIVRMPKVLQMETADSMRGMRVLIADDHQLYAEGLKNLLQTRGVQVVGIASDGREAQEMAEATQPELILMDVDMPQVNGLEAVQNIKERWPEMKVVMLTAVEDQEKMLTALRNGASGYLLKSVEGAQFFQMLVNALQGDTVLSPDLAASTLKGFAQSHKEALGAIEEVTLTFRQQEVLELVVQGLTNQEIAKHLSLTERTIKHHVSQILARYKLKSRYELAQVVTHRE